MNAVEHRIFLYINWALLACMFALYFIGVANLYSASGMRIEDGIVVSSFYQKQLIWGLLGTVVMLLAMAFDYRQLRSFAWFFFIAALILLLLVPVIGKSVYGAKRWLSLGFMNIQPSEIAKLSILILAARILSRDGQPLGWIDFIRVLLVGLVPCALIVIQPDLGTTLLILMFLACMILFHGLERKVFKACLIITPFIGLFMWFIGMRDYQRQRVLTFLDPTSDPRGSGYQILQSQIAIGSGEMWGKGYLQGTQSQLRFLPERHSDFVIAVFGEEWGFVGCVALITLYCLFLLAIFTTVAHAKDRFGSTLVAGIFFYFFWQIMINMGMVIGLMPVVGIPLPFLSYGGSATLVNFMLVGIVLNVSMRRFMFKG